MLHFRRKVIPEQAEVPLVARAPPSGQTAQAPQPAPPAAPSGGPNVNPLDLFPRGLPNVGSNIGASTLDFLRNSPQFRALQAMVQANPQILQPMLQELGKQNPRVMRLIQEHQSEFLSLINEPAGGGESNLLGQLASAMPQALTVTPEECEAIERVLPPLCAELRNKVMQPMILPMVFTIAESQGHDQPTLSIKTCLLKNFGKKVVAIGRMNIDAPSNDEAHNIIVDEIFDGNEMFARDRKFDDITVGKMINWPKYSVL